jgi:hypothetical protein
VEDVLAPVRHPGAGGSPLGLVDAVLVVPVHVPVAPVRIGDRRDRDDDLVANLLHERRIFDRHPIRQLHQHLGWTDLAAVQAARQVVDRLRFGDDLGRLAGGDRPRIGEPGQIAAIRVEVRDRLVGPDEHDDEVASLIARADRGDLDARRGGRERAVVLQDIGVVGELFWLADVVAEDVFGARNAGGFGQMVYQWAAELGPGGPLLHKPSKLRVVSPNCLISSRLRGDPESEAETEDRERAEKPYGASPERHDRTPYLRDT